MASLTTATDEESVEIFLNHYKNRNKPCVLYFYNSHFKPKKPDFKDKVNKFWNQLNLRDEPIGDENNFEMEEALSKFSDVLIIDVQKSSLHDAVYHYNSALFSPFLVILDSNGNVVYREIAHYRDIRTNVLDFFVRLAPPPRKPNNPAT